MFETLFFMLNAILLVFPTFYILMYDRQTLKENKSVYTFLRIYLIIMCLFFGFEIGVGVYFKLMKNLTIPYFALLGIMIGILYIMNLIEEEIEKENYYLVAGFFGVIIFLILVDWFYIPSNIPPTTKISATTGLFLLIFLIIIFIIPFAIMLLNSKLFEKKGIWTELSQKQMKEINRVFGIVIILCFFVSILGVIMIYDFSFSGQLNFGDSNEVMNSIFDSVLGDPLFQFTAGIIVFSAIARAFPNKWANIGGALAMVFMPMILWMQYLFSTPPQNLITLFLGWEIIAKAFYLILSTIGIVMLLAGANIIIGLVKGTF